TRFSRDWSSDVCSSDLSSGRGRIYQCGVRTTIGPHHPRLAYPTAPAFYPVPVRPLRSLPPASSPPRLTAPQLPLASDSGRHGSQRTSTSNISAMPGAHRVGGFLTVPASHTTGHTFYVPRRFPEVCNAR